MHSYLQRAIELILMAVIKKLKAVKIEQNHLLGIQDISFSQVSEILKQAKIAVLASKSEGLPLALLEYGYMSLPVVCTNVGDCSKVITAHENGLLIEAQHPQKLKEALNELVSSPNQATRLGMNLKTTVSNHFSESAILSKVTEIYKTVAYGY